MVSFLNSVDIESPNFNFIDEPRCHARETVGTRRFAYRRYSMPRNRLQERRKAGTPNDDVVAGERNPDLVIATLRIHELVPSQNQCLLRQDDFQRRGH